MICYLCGSVIPEDQPFYNGHEQQVCKPCFKETPRCFVCRFPGKQMEEVEGLGGECEFCRGKLVAEGDGLGPILQPLAPFLAGFGLTAPPEPRYEWVSLRALREMQTEADLPPIEFVDDFLRYCYPVYYKDGAFHCLKRMTKATFIVYALIQLAAADIAQRYGQPHLRGNSPFHTFARGFCHWVGYEAAGRLNYDLERRQLRKWPELGAMGEFERWESMARFNKTPKIVAFFRANLSEMGRRLGTGLSAAPAAEQSTE